MVFVHYNCFKVVDQNHPEDWIKKDTILQGDKWLLQGYPLFVTDIEHYNRLIDNEHDEVIKFFRLNNVKFDTK